MNDVINLNANSLFLSHLAFGWTQKLKIKVGRKFYLLDVQKTAVDVFLDLYPVTKNKSKYGPWLKSVYLKNPNAILDRRFFEHFSEIADAQKTLEAYMP